MARGRLAFKARGPKRKTTWAGFTQQGYVGVATTAKVLVASLDLAAFGLLAPTLVRSRGQVSLTGDATGTADSRVVGAFGMGIVSTDARAAGIASIPGPFSDSDWGGWAVLRPFSFVWEFGSNVGFARASVEIEVDSKAMRKIEANEELVFVAESQSGAFDISMPIRTLFMLG